MSSSQVSLDTATESSARAAVKMRFEVTQLPVADVDRAKSFYQGLGWRLDADFAGPGGGLEMGPSGAAISRGGSRCCRTRFAFP